jgi:hypothetical protein
MITMNTQNKTKSSFNKSFKFIIGLFLTALISTSQLFAQEKVWIEPDPTDVTQLVKLYVDLALTDDQSIRESVVYQEFLAALEAGDEAEAPVFIWTWNPRELPASDPNANGQWQASNPNLQMTHEPGIGPHVFSFSMVPVNFYGVPAADVYENGISFLAKAKNGGGFGDPDIKTEDLVLTVNPVGCVDKWCLSPSVFRANDIITVTYDNSQETAPNYQNITEEDARIFIEVIINGVTYSAEGFNIASPGIGTNPLYQMSQVSEGRFEYSLYLPDIEFRTSGGSPIPEGVSLDDLTTVRFTARRASFGFGAFSVPAGSFSPCAD